MKYSLTNQRMAQSMVVTEVLFGQDPSFLDEMGVTLNTDLSDCFICLTGIPRKICNDLLNKDLGDFLAMYEGFREDILRELGPHGIALNMILVKFDRSKRICCLMTVPPNSTLAAEEAAWLIHRHLEQTYRERWGIDSTDYPFFTALSDHLDSPAQLHAGFEAARTLTGLSYFAERPEVMTRRSYQERRKPFDSRMLAQSLQDIERCLLRGDCEKLEQELKKLFLQDLRHSFSFQMCDYALAGINRLVSRYNDIFLARIDPARFEGLATRNRLNLLDSYEEARSVLLECARASRKTGLSVGPVTLEAVQYLRVHYAEPFTVRQLAQHIGVSPNYLSSTFNEEVGESVPEYVTKVRLEHAKTLLVATDDTAASIGQQVGFASGKYFAQVFKERVGVTPAQYREEYRRHPED